ncbi:MAG: gamma carbonic anhydrase family protein [Betaproteobacteria bacterium]|jgi:carbonic anhydrase/acetyltransferase-like protein (isoleucine patch superfamily)
MTRALPLLLLPYLHHRPVVADVPVGGAGAAIIGRATLGQGVRLGALAVIRADGMPITVGDDFWMGARATLHIAHGLLPTVVGSGVTVGTNAVVHACTVGNGCVLEDNTVVLDGAVLGDGCVLAAGSVVFPRAELPPDHYCEGSPAKPVRPLTPEQLAAARARLRGLALANRETSMRAWAPLQGGTNYVAPTADLRGNITLGDNASVWFGCELQAVTHPISVGTNTNIQDNTVITSAEGAVQIGADVTVGHNVLIQSARIGDRTLIGIGSVLAPGTVVEDDVLLAAGAVTLPGQHLTAGSLWAGRPARRLAPLDDAKRQVVAYGAKHYVDYNRDYLGEEAPSP